MNPEISFEVRGAVQIVTFGRPETGNLFTGSMAKALFDKLKSIADNRGIRAVLLRSSGADFMLGHNMLAYNGETNVVQDQVFQKVQFFYGAIRELAGMDRPVVAAVRGGCAGAGLSFVAASDYVIAGRSASFSGGFVDYAMVPDGGATFFLPRKIGTGRAAEMLMLDEEVSADKAAHWGLVNQVVAPEQVDEVALAMAEKLAAGPTRTLALTKHLLAKSSMQDLNAQLSLEATFSNTGMKTFDFREAMKAFMAKKPPSFTGS